MDRARAFDITLASIRVVLGFFAILGGSAVGGFLWSAVHPLVGVLAAAVYAWCVWQVLRGLCVD